MERETQIPVECQEQKRKRTCHSFPSSLVCVYLWGRKYFERERETCECLPISSPSLFCICKIYEHCSKSKRLLMVDSQKKSFPLLPCFGSHIKLFFWMYFFFLGWQQLGLSRHAFKAKTDRQARPGNPCILSCLSVCLFFLIMHGSRVVHYTTYSTTTSATPCYTCLLNCCCC